MEETPPRDCGNQRAETGRHEVIKIDENDRRTNEIDYYTVTRAIHNTQDVQSPKTFERKLYNLNQQGIRINLRGPEFLIDPTFDEVELVRKATAYGKQRATLIESSDEKSGFRQTGSHPDHQKEFQRNL